MARVQKRTSFTSTVLARIKDFRVSGMTNPVADLVHHEREDEIRVGERSRVLTAVSASLSQLPQAIAPALAFAFGPHAINETRAYTSLSFLALLTAPLMVVLQSVPIIAACFACLRRIRVFLLQKERADRRLWELADDINDGPEDSDANNDTEAFVTVRNGTFGWTGENAVLKNINLCLPESSITFVVGPIASGKSTLCRALLGEVPHVQGSVSLRSEKVGYCDQVPFLFNTSVMENIVGFLSFDAVRYTEVIHATMLAEDLRTLPAGDSTIIGTKGISLSGGQRQRVSLARALYHDAEILVLDDVFSGLDGSTQHRVCQSVFGPEGLLRRRGTTAIICTHSTHFLSVADRIVALASDGTIAEQGGFAEIWQDEQRARRVGLAPTSDFIDKPSSAGMGAIDDEIQADRRPTPTPIDIPLTKPRPTPPVTTPPADFDVYRHWLSAIGLLPLVFFFILVVGNGFFSNFPNIWVKLWSADSMSPNPEHSFAYWIGIYALLGAGVVLCVFPAGLIMLRTAVRLAGLDFHHATVQTVMHCSLRFLGNTDVGKILNLFSQDMNIMDTQLPRMVNNLSFCLANAVGQAVVIAVSSAWLVISYPFFIALLWVVQRVYLPTSKRLRVLDLEAKTPL
jgi:ABC-type multidrug transport system fused ATPase/permease subunit